MYNYMQVRAWNICNSLQGELSVDSETGGDSG